MDYKEKIKKLRIKKKKLQKKYDDIGEEFAEQLNAAEYAEDLMFSLDSDMMEIDMKIENLKKKAKKKK